jgi:hypothetical protein
MDKNRLTDELNQVQVPTSELQDAIKNGIARAKKEKEEKPIKKKSNIIRSSGIAAAVTIGVLGSGFIFPQMSGILANFPYLDKVYSTFQDKTGETLSNKDLVTELNEEVVSSGIAVKATSAYYDNRKITVTFEVDKEELKVLEEDIKKFSFDFELVKDEHNWKLDASFNATYDDKKGYMIIELTPPEDVELKNYTLPITLTNVGGTEGEWKFNIAVEQLESKETKIGQTFTDKNGEYTFTVDKLVHGQGSTIIEHTVQAKDEHENVDFFYVYDQDGNKYQFNGIQERDVKKVGEYFEIKYQTPVTKMPEDIKAFTLEMTHHRSEPNVIIPLNKLPYTFESTRKDAKVMIDKAERQGDELYINYQIEADNETEEFLVRKIDQLSFAIYEAESIPKMDERYEIPEKDPERIQYKGIDLLNAEKRQFQVKHSLQGSLMEDGITRKQSSEPLELEKYAIHFQPHGLHSVPASMEQQFKVDVK